MLKLCNQRFKLPPYTVQKVFAFPRYNMKCSEENVILRGIVHVVSGFPLHFMFYRGNLDCISNRVGSGSIVMKGVRKYFCGAKRNKLRILHRQGWLPS